MSTTTSINIGIRQGSVLGPIFFNIMYKQPKNCANKFDTVSYADDTTLISTKDSFTSPNTNISDNINSELKNVNKCMVSSSKALFECDKNKIHDVPYSTKTYSKIAPIYQQYCHI